MFATIKKAFFGLRTKLDFKVSPSVKAPPSVNEQTLNFLLIGLNIVMLSVMCLYALFKHFPVDEFEAMQTAWKISQGETIFVDFFQHHHPFFFYIIAGIIKIFGPTSTSFIVARIFVYLILLCFVAMTFFLAKKFFNKTIALISTLIMFLTPGFTWWIVEIKPNILQSVFGLAAVYYLLSYVEGGTFLQRRQTRLFFISSFLCSISFLISMKAIFFLVPVGFVILYYMLQDLLKKKSSSGNKKLTFGKVFLFGAIFSFPLGLYFLYLIFTNSFLHYLEFNWLLNKKINVANSFLPISSITSFLRYFYIPNPTIWLFYGIGILFFKKTNVQKVFTFISIGIFLTILFLCSSARAPSFQMFMPFAAIIIAYALYNLCKKNKTMLAVFTLILVTPYIPVYLRGAFLTSNREQLKRIDYIVDITEEDDYILGGEHWYNVYRKNTNFFWFLRKVRRYAPSYEACTNLKEEFLLYKPKLVLTLLPSGLQDKNLATLAGNNYMPDKTYPDILIRKNNKK